MGALGLVGAVIEMVQVDWNRRASWNHARDWHLCTGDLEPHGIGNEDWDLYLPRAHWINA